MNNTFKTCEEAIEFVKSQEYDFDLFVEDDEEVIVDGSVRIKGEKDVKVYMMILDYYEVSEHYETLEEAKEKVIDALENIIEESKI